MRIYHFFLPVMLAALASCGGGSESSGPATGTVVASVIVSSPASSLQVGQTVQFSAEARDSKGTLLPASQTAWSVSPSTIASVTASGLVTATAAGTATVTATIQNVSGNRAVAIIDAGIPSTATVSMPGNSFSPFNVTVKQNGTVRFEFPSTPHNVIFSKPGSPGDIQVTSNVTISRTFSAIGTFPYDCTIHPGMSGQVTVVQ